MNNKKNFSVNAYLKNMKSLSLVGGICTVCLLLISVLVPMSIISGIKSDLLYNPEFVKELPNIYDCVGNSSFLLISFMLLTPVLALVGWNYLTKRNACDFFHSLPYTRRCLYLTKLAAIVSWQLIMLLVSMFAVMIIVGANSYYLTADLGVLFRVYMGIFMCNLLCMSSITLACTLTGTVFSNVCVSGLIIFAPRFVVYVAGTVINSSSPLVSSDNIIGMKQNLNMLFALTGSQISSRFGSINENVLSASSVIYVLVLSMIYLIIAGLVFHIRKSESAGCGAISMLAHRIIEGVIGFFISFIGVLIYVDTLRSEDGPGVNVAIIAFIVALIVVFVYECIATKSVKLSRKCIPTIAVAYVCSIICGFGVNRIIDLYNSRCPDASDISYVSIASTPNEYQYSSGGVDYYNSKLKEIRLTTNEEKSAVLEALSDNVAVIKDGTVNDFYRFIGRQNFERFVIEYKDGLFTQTRIVYLSAEQIVELTKALTADETFNNVKLEMPEYKELTSTYISSSQSKISKDNMKLLYETMAKEVSNMSFAQLFATTNYTYGSTGSYSASNVFTARFIKDGMTYCISFPISNMFPETSALYNYMN